MGEFFSFEIACGLQIFLHAQVDFFVSLNIFLFAYQSGKRGHWPHRKDMWRFASTSQSYPGSHARADIYRKLLRLHIYSFLKLSIFSFSLYLVRHIFFCMFHFSSFHVSPIFLIFPFFQANIYRRRSLWIIYKVASLTQSLDSSRRELSSLNEIQNEYNDPTVFIFLSSSSSYFYN